MPSKSREYYLTTSSSRDLAWFFFRITTPQPPRRKPEPPPPYRIPTAHRAKMASITEEPRLALMAPDDFRAPAVTIGPGPTKPNKPKSKKAGSRNAGPWSDWYVSEDGSYFWRARQYQNKTWDYQFTPALQEPTFEEPALEEPAQTPDSTPTTSSNELSRPSSPSPEKPPGSPNPNNPSLDPTSPKSSWPTILTTSTGQPTETLSASSSRTLVTLPKEGDGISQPVDNNLALVPPAATTRTPPAQTNNKTNQRSSNKRPVGPVMRLLQEGRSRKNKAKTEVTKSTAANTAAAAPGTGSGGDVKLQGHVEQGAAGPGRQDSGNGSGGGGGGGGGGGALTKDRTTPALAKKLHAKVKSEKELKVDPKRRVKAWLKGVEVDLAPIPLDAQGFPIYR